MGKQVKLVHQYQLNGTKHHGLVRQGRLGMDAIRSYRTDLTLAGLDVPVVVVRGAQDRIAGGSWSRSLASLARGRLHTVEGAAHMVPLTHPEAVVSAVREVGCATSETLPT